MSRRNHGAERRNTALKKPKPTHKPQRKCITCKKPFVANSYQHVYCDRKKCSPLYRLNMERKVVKNREAYRAKQSAKREATQTPQEAT